MSDSQRARPETKVVQLCKEFPPLWLDIPSFAHFVPR